MCWPFSSPGGFSLLGKNALIEIFFFAYLSMKRKKPQEFKTNESILSILTIIKVKKNTFFDPFIKIFSNDFFQPLKSGKKLRWEAYSNFHQRLLQKTWGRVNYGISRPIISWRQNAWLWSTSLKVKYDWENCFCPKKCSLVKKLRSCWEKTLLSKAEIDF